MDVLARLYQILKARSASIWARRETLHGEEGHENGASDTSSWPPPGSGQDEILAGYYANLDLHYGADLAAVKVAWKRLMKKYHPDCHAQDPAKREVANELCAELTRAYRELEKCLSVP